MPRQRRTLLWVSLALFLIFGFSYAINLTRF